MKIKKVVRFVILINYAFVGLGICIFLFGAKPMGYLEARHDIMRGHYKIKSFGWRPFLSYENNSDLLKLHGIERVAVAGCVVNDFIVENVSAYNEAMKNVIQDKFGIDGDHLE